MNDGLIIVHFFLDTTKAFGRIRYCKLFRPLSNRSILACIIRVLLCLYTNNFVRVAWNGALLLARLHIV